MVSKYTTFICMVIFFSSSILSSPALTVSEVHRVQLPHIILFPWLSKPQGSWGPEVYAPSLWSSAGTYKREALFSHHLWQRGCSGGAVGQCGCGSGHVISEWRPVWSWLWLQELWSVRGNRLSGVMHNYIIIIDVPFFNCQTESYTKLIHMQTKLLHLSYIPFIGF